MSGGSGTGPWMRGKRITDIAELTPGKLVITHHRQSRLSRQLPRSLNMTKHMHVLIVGDPIDGFKIIGPVEPNSAEVDEYIERDLRNKTWWMVEVEPLATDYPSVKAPSRRCRGCGVEAW